MKQIRIKAGRSESSSTVDEHKGWLALWGANIPGKVKVHIWRLIRSGLAVGSELERRRIKAGIFCVACGREETVLHRFWLCPHAQQVWLQVNKQVTCGSPPPEEVRNQSLLSNWMLEWLASVQEAELDITLMTLYQIWLERNDARENKAIECPEAVGRRAVALVEEWQEVHAQVHHVIPKPKERWRPPMQGWVKVNTDGAMVKSSDTGGGGVVVRDHDGRFLAGSCHFFPSLSSPEEAELRACEKGMDLIKRLKLKNVVLELDCAAVVAKLNGVEVDRSSQGLLIEKLKRALREVNGHVIKWARRTANTVAHKLAKEGCGMGCSKTWFLFPPSCIKVGLDMDLSVD
jgi:ribonuclease HI